jgi:hypothetical protein
MSKLHKLSVKDLFAITLGTPLSEVEWRDDWDEKYKPRKRGIFKIYPWDALGELERRGTRKIYRKARKLCHSENPNERQVGVYIIGNLGGRDNSLYRKRRRRLLLNMVDEEGDPKVQIALASVLGNFDDYKIASVNSALLNLSHRPDAAVRLFATTSLDSLDYEYAEIVDRLIELSQDEADGVRDWATYRLRLLEFDSKAIREALFARLTDSDYSTRCEAIWGLVRRSDGRAFAPLLAELEHIPCNWADWHLLPWEAARDLADARLLPALYRLLENAFSAPVGIFDNLVEAITACKAAQAESDQ